VPSPFYEISKRFGLRRLLGTSNVHDVGTGFQALGADIDNINHGHQDFLQAGVVGEADWTFTANIVSGTGELGSTGTTGGKVWVPDPVLSGALMRTVTPLAKLEKIKPGSLPSNGKYMSVAFELAPAAENGWDNAVTVTAHSGTEKSTEAEAIAAPPATTAGKVQVRRVIIKNTAGVYSIVAAQEDIRSRAVGGVGPWEFPSVTAKVTNIGSVFEMGRGRLESSGNSVRLAGSIRIITEIQRIEAFMTLPVSLRPPNAVYPVVSTNAGPCVLIIEPNGKVSLSVATPPGSGPLTLDGATYSIT
jgi:hypothetical protein